MNSVKAFMFGCLLLGTVFTLTLLCMTSYVLYTALQQA
jgi:hypothetical protein